MNFNAKKVWLIVFAVIAIAFIGMSGKLIEFIDNSEVCVIQGIGGGLTVVTDAGPAWQGWGTATHYKKSNQLWFSKLKEEGDTTDKSIKVRFNDGGHGTISGSIRWYMPTDAKTILKLHTDFGSQAAIENQLLKQAMTKSIYMSGPLMSSKESAAELRPNLLTYIEDQAINGIYLTKQRQIKDTTSTKTLITEIVIGKNGVPQRLSDVSPVAKYGITLEGLVINSIDYDDAVEKQIKQQQELTMAVQTSKANATKSIQDAITVEQKGKADAAKAKWDQEVIKAKLVTEAEQKKEVAELNALTALADAKAIRTTADAESYKNRQLVSAGLTPQEAAQFAMDTKIGVAEALSKMQLPTTYFSGMSGNGNGGGSMLESILGSTIVTNLMTGQQAKK